MVLVGIFFSFNSTNDSYQPNLSAAELESRQTSFDLGTSLILSGLAIQAPVIELASNTIDCISGYCDPNLIIPGSTTAYAEVAEEAAESGDKLLYRGMKTGEDGLPAIGSSGRTLGVREDDIIPVDGLVNPNSGGMSVSPNSPMNLPVHRRPAEFNGTGSDPVWCISVCDLGPNLAYRPDPINPTEHGFIEPAFPMLYNQYQAELWKTKSNWKKIETSP